MEVLIPIAVFAMIPAIVIVPNWLKARERSEMQATLRTAIDKGQPMPPEVIDALTKTVKLPPNSISDLRTGIIWVGVGLGLGAFGYITSYEWDEAFHVMGGIGAIPAIIGLTYVVLSFFNPNKGKQS
jgi:hypothetical protein